MTQTTSTDLGPLMVDVDGLVLTDDDRKFLSRPEVGGIILFSRNYQSPEQLRALTTSIREVRPGILIAVDQEGGRVQRFRQDFLRLPPLGLIGNAYDKNAAQGLRLADICGWAMAAQVINHGVDFSFAPVLDLYNVRSEVIADRAFSDSVGTVVVLAKAYIKGMARAGMAATGKHFPGHGSVVADSHVALPIDERSKQEILTQDYEVFAQCAKDLAAMMPAHVKYPALDPSCAGFSEYWIQTKLRGELGFTGVVFSDDLTMAAASDAGDICARTARAIEAGCNMILVCNNRATASEACDYLSSISLTDINQNLDPLSTMSASKPVIEDLYNTKQWKEAVELISALAATQ